MTTSTTYATTTARWPYWLSLAAGILIVIAGIILAVAGTVIAALYTISGVSGLVLGIIGVIIGAIIIWAAYKIPASRVMYGGLIVVLSIVAFFVVGGGFIIGSILGVIGGLWAMLLR